MTYLMKKQTVVALALTGGLLAGCSGGNTGGSNGIPKISTTNPIATGTLKFAVGTANLYGTATGLNVVSTYRQANGLSNVLLDSPTITGPFILPAAGTAGGGVDDYSTLPSGPSVEETAHHGRITSTLSSLAPGEPACDQVTPCTVDLATGGTTQVAPNTSTFGQSGGVFTNGLSPGNSTVNGVAASYVPYSEPLYDTTSGNQFTPFGGPPAFDPNKTGLGLRDGLSNIGAGVVGIPEGFTPFAGVRIGVGTFTLSLSVPTSTSSSSTVSATASLASAALLPTIVAPTLTLDGTGGGTLAVTLPAGVTEEYVEIVDFGPDGLTAPVGTSCQGAIGAAEGAGPVYYTIVATASGVYSLPDTIGPNTDTTGGIAGITPSPSICTAAQNTAANGGTATDPDTYTVQAIGVDYPAYESTYPITASAAPTLVGAGGQADITISAVAGPFPVVMGGSNNRSMLLQGHKKTLELYARKAAAYRQSLGR
jgi:hypothetical protein